MSGQTHLARGLSWGWAAWREPDSRKWSWTAFAGGGETHGTARSEPEAREKASRAAEDLRRRG